MDKINELKRLKNQLDMQIDKLDLEGGPDAGEEVELKEKASEIAHFEAVEIMNLEKENDVLKDKMLSYH